MSEDRKVAIITGSSQGLGASIAIKLSQRNIDIVEVIQSSMGVKKSLISFVKDRLGHDFRYAIDHSKITNELGWKPKIKFEDGIKKTIDFYTKTNKEVSV